MCRFVRARMSLAIVRSHTLIFYGSREKEAHIHHRPYLLYRAVMAMTET